MTSLSAPQRPQQTTPVAMGRPSSDRKRRKYQLHCAITQASNDKQIKRGTGDFLHWLLRQAQVVDYGVRMARTELAHRYGKSLSSIKNYLVEAARAAFVQITRLGEVRFPFLDDQPPPPRTYDDLVAEAFELAMDEKYLDAGLALKRAATIKDQRLDPAPAAPIQASFFVAPEQTINEPSTDNFVPDPSFKEDQTDRSGEARPPTPRGGNRRRRHVFFGREEVPDTPGVDALKAAGVRDKRTLIRLANCAAGDVVEVVTALRARLGPDGFGPGLIVHTLEFGLWRVRGHGPPAAHEPTLDFREYCPVCFGYPVCKCEDGPPGGS